MTALRTTPSVNSRPDALFRGRWCRASRRRGGVTRRLSIARAGVPAATVGEKVMRVSRARCENCREARTSVKECGSTTRRSAG